MAGPQTITLYIPCYNGETYIAGCIESVLRQSRRPDEILVIDDGSTDRTAEIAGRYPEVTVIRHEKNRGLAAARNTAIAAATGDLIASLDADCVADENWLMPLAWILEHAGDRVAGIGGKLVEAFQETAPDFFRATYMRQHKGDKSLPQADYVAGANTVFRRKALQHVGGYSEAFRTNGEDVHICYLLRCCGYLIIYEPSAVVQHQRRDTVESVIRMNWAHWCHPAAVVFPLTSLPRALHRMTRRFKYCLDVIRADLAYKRYRLLPISLRSAAITPWWAIRDWWRIWRSGDAAAIELKAERARTFDAKLLQRPESSAAPQAQYN